MKARAGRSSQLLISSLLLCAAASGRAAEGGSAPPTQIFSRHYTTDHGLAASQVFCSYQDQRGYLWFGTPGGLNRYNGQQFAHYTVEDGLVHQSTRGIVEHDGALYIGSEGGVSRFDGERFSRLGKSQGLGQGIVWRVREIDGSLWVGTNEGGLCQLRQDRFYCYTTAQGLPSDSVSDFLPRADGIWISTRGGGLARLQGERAVAVGTESGLTARDVRTLIEHRGQLYVGAHDGGVFRLEGERFVQLVADVNVYSSGVWQGDLLFGTLGQGLIRLRSDGRQERLTSANGLASDRVYSLLTDREGTLWVTTSNGISKIPSDRFRTYLKGKNVIALREHQGAIWFGTLGDGLWRLAGGAWTRFGKEDGLGDEVVWSIASYRGRLWVSTREALLSYDGRDFTSHSLNAASAGSVYSVIYNLLVDGELMWISTINGVFRFDGQRFTRLGTEQGLPSNHVRSAVRWRDRVCFCTDGGLACWDGRKLQSYGTAQGLASNSIYVGAVDEQQRLWLGTNNGLSRLDGQTIVSFSERDGLSDNFVASVGLFADQLWLGTNRGAAVMEGDQVVTVLDKRHGLAANELNMATLLVQDRRTLWLGTTDGATRYQLESSSPAAPGPPPVYIESMQVNNEPQAGLAGLVLPYEQNNVSFSFAGLAFSEEEDVSFRFQLVGFDKKWSAATGQRQIRYTNLPPGKYAFRVSARARQGGWSPPTSLGFAVRPPFFRSWWFYLLVCAGSLGLAYLGFRLRLRGMQRHTEELERLVQDRTIALASANEDLRRLALTDPLTQLGNRRLLAETIQQEINTVRRIYSNQLRGKRHDERNRDIGFFIIDLDHFKRVNDTYGHAAGDQLLQQIAARLRSEVRQQDIIIRWGGEEFLVVGRQMNRQHVDEFARRVARNVSHEPYVLADGASVTITCSVGHCVYPFSTEALELLSYEDVINLADQALYLAKLNGRDQVVGIAIGDKPLDPAVRKLLREDLAQAAKRRLIRVISDKQQLSLGPQGERASFRG